MTILFLLLLKIKAGTGEEERRNIICIAFFKADAKYLTNSKIIQEPTGNNKNDLCKLKRELQKSKI